MKHLMTLKNTQILEVADEECFLCICANESMPAPEEGEKYSYMLSIFQEFKEFTYYYLYLTVISTRNPNHIFSERISFLPTEKEFMMLTYNLNLQGAFGPHEIDVLQFESENKDEIKEKLLSWKTLH